MSFLFLESVPCEGRDPFDLKVSRTFFLPVLLKIPSPPSYISFIHYKIY